MARTVQEIYNALIAAKEAEPDLAVLSSNSKTAIWRLLLYIVAYVMALHEALWDKKAEQLKYLAKSSIVGTIAWYIEMIRMWQYGYTLEYINNVYTYSIIDDNAKLVKRIAIKPIERGILVKVAKEDTSGNPQALSHDELTELKAYINQIKIAGTMIDVVSLNADKLSFDMTVYYTTSYTQVKSDVINAINNYLASLNFDAAITRADIITVINNVDNVHDVVITRLQHQYGNNIIDDIDRIAYPSSGYWELDGGNNFTNTNIVHDDIIISNSNSRCNITFRLYV